MRRAAALAAMIMLAPASVVAQTDDQRADARAAAEQGAQAFEEGRLEEAVDLFTRAESLVHAPPHLLYIARAQVKLGQLVRARENYRKIEREKLPATAPPAFHNAQAAAQKELAELEPRIPMVKIVVKGAGEQPVTVSVNGKQLPAAMIGVARPMDPGDHTFTASAPGLAAGPTTAKIPEAARETVELELVASAGATPAGGVAGSDASRDPVFETSVAADSAGTSGMRIAAYAALGVGVIGVGAGTFFALQSSSKRKDADALCEGGCPVSKRDEIQGLYDDAGSAQTLSMVGFIVGGVGLAGGVTLLLIDPGSEREASGVRPWLGLGSAGVSGRF
jgi:hypothetical protein